MFPLNMSCIYLNYVFLLFWSIFWDIHWKLLFFSKIWYLRKMLRNTLKICFSKKFEMVKSRAKFDWCYKCFVKTCKIRQISTKTVFLLNISQIQLNYAFLLFWSIFGEIHWKILFLVKKEISQKEAQKYSKHLFFSTNLKIQRTIWICGKQLFWFKPVKWDKY